MGPITQAMIRRRAEHNDGVFETLEELVLQEENIDKIELLGRLCPNLKVLYMPNNLIPRIENMRRLKSLEYLNLTLNNISKIEGLEGCEALKKLDLTLNFVGIDTLPTIAKLQANIHLVELFMTGNPCTDFPGYRKYVIGALPSLKHLDASRIKPSERIVARKEFCQIQEELFQLSSSNVDSSVDDPDLAPVTTGKRGEVLRPYSVATRLAEHKEMQEMRGEAERSSKANDQQSQEPLSKRRKGFEPLPKDGRIFQKNEGGWGFKIVESDCGKLVLLDVVVGRYLDTSLIDIDIHPTLVRILIKGKLLQLKLPCEVRVDESFAKRSTTTGCLLITFPKVTPDSFRAYMRTSSSAIPQLRQNVQHKTSFPQNQNDDHGDDKNGSDVVSVHDIVVNKSNSSMHTNLKPKTFIGTTDAPSWTPSIPCKDVSMIVDSDIPPLE